MDIIEMARELGRQLQKEEAYIKLRTAIQATEEDEALQNLIGEFNLKKLAINNEASKQDRDDEKLQVLNKEMRQLYTQIIMSTNMQTYNRAQSDMDLLLKRVQTILTASANGEDPDTADYDPSSGCSGSCATCGGCG